MINTILNLLNEPSVNWPISIITHCIIFLGTLYIAIYNRRLPTWHITPIWWIGLAQLFALLTIVLEYLFGMNFPLSNFNMGIFTHTLTNLTLAYLVLVMLIATLRLNSKG